MSEHNETPSSGPEEAEELDDLFLSPEDSEGEIVAEVDASGGVQATDSPADDSNAGDGSNEPQSVGIGEIVPERVEASVEQVSSAELEAANEKIKDLETERDDVKNRMMRVAADLENFRKRAAREREDMRKYGIDKVVLELIPVLDNLERALQHAENNAEDNSITEGVRMVYRQFITAFEKHGVRGFESKGDQFDPQKHEAIQQVETDEHETGTVLEEYQKGYFLHDRLIRPAMVSVAKKTTAPTVVESEEDVVEPATEGDASGEPAVEINADPDEVDTVEEPNDAAPSEDDVSSEDDMSDDGQDDTSDDTVGSDGEDSDPEGMEESTDVGM